MKEKQIIHPIKPIYDKNSQVLILGSFPSVKSREASFYYAHPQNRFWRVISSICQSAIPESNEEKERLLRDNHIAVWDVIHSCEITGSADSTIKNVVPNDISEIINNSAVSRIFTNGKKANALYCKYLESQTGIKAVCLPSTSPANASWSIEKLTEQWKKELMEK